MIEVTIDQLAAELGMDRLELRRTGPLTPEQVWHRYAVPALWATWAPHIVGVDYPAKRLRAAAMAG